MTIFKKKFSSLLKNNLFITDTIEILTKITNNEIYKEIMFNIKFNGKPNICVPFDAVADVYLYDSNKLKEEIKLKKYPKLTLVIERKYHKEFIPLTGFREKEINILVEEIEIVRDSYEESI